MAVTQRGLLLEELSALIGVRVLGVRRSLADPGQTRCAGAGACAFGPGRPSGRCLPACGKYRSPTPAGWTVVVPGSPFGPLQRRQAVAVREPGATFRRADALTRWAVVHGRDPQASALSREQQRRAVRLLYKISHEDGAAGEVQ